MGNNQLGFDITIDEAIVDIKQKMNCITVMLDDIQTYIKWLEKKTTDNVHSAKK